MDNDREASSMDPLNMPTISITHLGAKRIKEMVNDSIQELRVNEALWDTHMWSRFILNEYE